MKQAFLPSRSLISNFDQAVPDAKVPLLKSSLSSSYKSKRRVAATTAAKKTMDANTGIDTSPPTKKIPKMRLKKNLFTSTDQHEVPANVTQTKAGFPFWDLEVEC